MHVGILAMRALRAAFLLCMGMGAAFADGAGTVADPAAMLAAGYTAFEARHAQDPFHSPLYLESREGADSISGEIFALVNYRFAIAAAALDKPSRWCDILILHLNTKYCRPSTGSPGAVLHVAIGKKYDQPLEAAYRLDFAYRVVVDTASYLQVKLDADEGPFGTRDYRIVLEAAPAGNDRTLIRLSYAYSYGLVGRMAMQVYLDTIGRSKVGFTVVDRDREGRPRYIGGVRGIVERNTMRYYLAIESFLGALSVPPRARMEKSLNDWFSAIERYPRQLHEMERSEYLEMKRKEYSRQQSGAATGTGSVNLGTSAPAATAMAAAHASR